MSDNRTRITCVLSALIAAGIVAVPAARTSTHMPRRTADPHARERARAASLQLPMRFDPSVGAGGVGFIARGPNYAVYLSANQTTLQLASSSAMPSAATALSMRLVGGHRHPSAPAGLEPLPGTTNYLIGNDPRLWKTGIHGYHKVEYRDVYPGVNVIYYGNQRQLEYDFVLAPGARVSDIAIAFDGATHVAIDADGGLRIATTRGTLQQPLPVVYQDFNDVRRPVEGGFVVDKAGHIGFRVGRYDHRLPLVIDPVLTYSTYLGGGAGDASMGVAVGADGSIYLAGETTSLDFPQANGALVSGGGSLDAFVVKLNPTGDQLVYATYLGGSSYEYAKDVAVDAAGNAYVTGSTTSRNFPTLHALQSTLSGFSDGFVTKLDATGVIVYSTYLGGRGEDCAYGIAVDSTGRAHVTGQTISPDFPTRGAFQPQLGGGAAWKSTNGFQSWSALSSLIASSLISFAIDSVSPLVVYAGTETGVAKSVDGGQTWTDSANFGVPVRALAIDPITTSTVYAGVDGAVLRSTDSAAMWTGVGVYGASVTSLAIDPTAPLTIYAAAVQSSYSRGVSKSIDGGDHWTDVGMGATIWSLGLSRSSPSTIYAGSDFGVFKTTTGGAAWTSASSGLKSRVSALAVDPTDPSTVYAGTDAGLFITTSGGNQWVQLFGDSISSVVIPPHAHNIVYAASAHGGVAVSGDSGATWTFGGPGSPIYALAVDPVVPTTVYGGGSALWDAFVTTFSPDGSALEYSTYFGGTGSDYATAVAVDSTGSVYIVGATMSIDLPVVNPLQATFAGMRDLFVAKISPAGALTYATYLGGAASEDGGTIAVDASGQAHVAGYTLSGNFPTANAYQSTFGGGDGDAFVTKLTATGNGLVYSTFLGGSGSEMGPHVYTVGRDPVVSIALTPSGEAYVTGATSSTNFPIVRALQPTHGGGEYDAFVARLSAGGLLQWSTFLGGSAGDFGKRIAVDPIGGVVVTGFTDSTNFPLRNPLQGSNGGFDDAFVARIEDPGDFTPPVTTIDLSGTGGPAGWYRSSVVVTLAATDLIGESGVAFVDYQINDAPFQRYAGAFTVAAEGATRVTARATDNAGNVEPVPPSALITIDTGAPALQLDAPVERDYLHSDMLALSFSARDDVSGLVNGSPWGTLDGALATNAQQIQLLTLSLGAHTVVASASDVAGNMSQRSVTFHVVATIRSLIASVNLYAAQGKIDPATENRLRAKLNDAQAALDRGNVTVVRNKLSDFIDVCTKRLPADVANVLVADARYVLSTL
ncbi:MAG: hypothetical protein DMF99_24660 [Acidobacteria bacterium]|nr:MAG: hypothetical protein DMF99_24660 [Acidobacteriota bacterium]